MMYMYHALITVCVHVLIVDRDDVPVPCIDNCVCACVDSG